MSGPLSLILEFARATQGGDPYAFQIGRQDYLLRRAGGSFESAALDWNATLLSDLEAIRRPGRDPLAVQRLGETLRRFLQPTGWSEQESQILSAVTDRRRVVLTLRSAAAELYSLPWELVTLKNTGQHLAELPGLLVRYEWPDTSSAPTRAQMGLGRLLLGWSAAAGAVPAAEHIAALVKSCPADSDSFLPDRDVLSNVSLPRLADALEAAQNAGPPITVLHLLCHGAVVGSTFGLAFDGDEAGSKGIVDAGRLRQILAPYAGMVRLIILSACDSGNSGAIGNQLGSVAQALHRAGLAHVVASRYPLSVPGSIRLAEALYQEMLSGSGSLEEALPRARTQLALSASHLDWASLQLYARVQDPAFQWRRRPRVEIDRTRDAVHEAISAVRTEWQDRLNRQVDYVLTEAEKRLAHLEVTDRVERGEHIVELEPTWQREFEPFVNEAMTNWVQSNTGHVTAALNKALQPVVQTLAAAGMPPGQLVQSGTSSIQALRMSLEPTRSPLPGTFDLLFGFSRQHVALTLACTVGVAALSGILAASGLHHGRLLALLALPVVILAAYLAVRAERQVQFRTRRGEGRDRFTAAAKAELRQLVERQRAILADSLITRLSDGAQRKLETVLPRTAREDRHGLRSAPRTPEKSDP